MLLHAIVELQICKLLYEKCLLITNIDILVWLRYLGHKMNILVMLSSERSAHR